MGPDLSDYGIEGRQTDMRKADLERGFWIVVVPEPDSQWVAHLWRKGTEILGDRKQAEELCCFLKDKGFNAVVLKIAPDTEALLKEVSEIVQRQRTGLVALAGTDGGVTDYQVKTDLFRLLEIADQVAQKR